MKILYRKWGTILFLVVIGILQYLFSSDKITLITSKHSMIYLDLGFGFWVLGSIY